MQRSTRRIIASLALMVYLLVYIIIAYTIGSYIAEARRWATLLYFIAAGVVWIFPLRPLFAWMNSGPEEDFGD